MSDATKLTMMKRIPTCKKILFHKVLNKVHRKIRKQDESPFQRIRDLLWSLGSYLKVSLSISSSRFGNPIYRQEIDPNEVKNVKYIVGPFRNISNQVCAACGLFCTSKIVIGHFFPEGICRKTPVARIQQSSRAGGSSYVYVLRSNKPLREVSLFWTSVVIGVVVASNP